MLEPSQPVEPPEIRVPDEKYQVVEFYVDLGVARPDLELFRIILGYLQDEAARPLIHLAISYHQASEKGEPSMLVGFLTLGDFIDIG